MSARGDYRAIYTVLWNGPDWQRLPAEARLVWLALKGNCGPTGIACLPAVEHQVARWTGLDVPAVSRAFAILSTQGWMVSASDVVWVRGGITYEPSRHVGNANHRQAARDHVAGLPHVPIVAAFVREHPDWFPPHEAQPVIPWAFSDDRPAPKLIGPGYVPDGMGDGIGDRKAITETETETEYGVTTFPAASASGGSVAPPPPPAPKVKPEPKYPHYPPDACNALWEAWREKVGAVPYARFRRDTAPLFDRPEPYAPVPELVAAIAAAEALESSRRRKQFLTPASFVGQIAEWVRVVRASPEEKMRLLDEAEGLRPRRSA